MRRGVFGRPASENLQGRKPREWERGACRRGLWGFERLGRATWLGSDRSSKLADDEAVDERAAGCADSGAGWS